MNEARLEKKAPPRRVPSRRCAALLGLTMPGALLSALACTPADPGAKINKLRSTYTVQLNSYRLEQTPIPAAEPAAGETTSTGEEATIMSAAELAATVPAVRTDVVLDIIVGTSSEETLDGLTVELEHVDGDRRVKGQQKLWLDTKDIVRGSGSQVYARLENVDYAEGDAFAVSLRGNVPVEERGAYREFAAAGS